MAHALTHACLHNAVRAVCVRLQGCALPAAGEAVHSSNESFEEVRASNRSGVAL